MSTIRFQHETLQGPRIGYIWFKGEIQKNINIYSQTARHSHTARRAGPDLQIDAKGPIHGASINGIPLATAHLHFHGQDSSALWPAFYHLQTKKTAESPWTMEITWSGLTEDIHSNVVSVLLDLKCFTISAGSNNPISTLNFHEL